MIFTSHPGTEKPSRYKFTGRDSFQTGFTGTTQRSRGSKVSINPSAVFFREMTFQEVSDPSGHRSKRTSPLSHTCSVPVLAVMRVVLAVHMRCMYPIVLINLSAWDLSTSGIVILDMPGTFHALVLKQDGDVETVKVKQAGDKASLKDIQLYLKKKVAPALLVSYAYGDKRLSMLGYSTGKESEITQHQLPPPCEHSDLYGSLVLLVHPLKTTWDTSTPLQFTASDYEIFYEKLCSGELDDEQEAEVDVEAEAEVEEEEEELEDVDDVLEDAEVDAEVDAEAEGIEEVVEPRVRTIRKAIKPDAYSNQFKYTSTLVPETEVNATAMSSEERKKVHQIMKDLFVNDCSDADTLELERGIFNASIQEATHRHIPHTWEHATFKWIYMMISKRVIGNFYTKSYIGNKSLFERWKEGEFTLDQIGSWDPYEMNPTQWKDLKDQQFRREKKVLEGNLAMATDRFRCSQCKKKLCSYYELQTRSADEPMTIFVTCLNCGKQWRQ